MKEQSDFETTQGVENNEEILESEEKAEIVENGDKKEQKRKKAEDDEMEEESAKKKKRTNEEETNFKGKRVSKKKTPLPEGFQPRRTERELRKAPSFEIHPQKVMQKKLSFAADAGEGKGLGEIVFFEEKVQKSPADSAVLIGIHKLIYKTAGTRHNRKKEIKKWRGVPKQHKDEEEKRMKNVLKKSNFTQLKEYAKFIGISPKNKDECADELVDFFLHPTEAKCKQLVVKKMKTKKGGLKKRRKSKKSNQKKRKSKKAEGLEEDNATEDEDEDEDKEEEEKEKEKEKEDQGKKKKKNVENDYEEEEDSNNDEEEDSNDDEEENLNDDEEDSNKEEEEKEAEKKNALFDKVSDSSEKDEDEDYEAKEDGKMENEKEDEEEEKEKDETKNEEKEAETEANLVEAEKDNNDENLQEE